MIKFFLVLSLVMSSTFAAGFSTKDFSVALGLQGQSLLYKRGIITYKGYQLLPVFAVQLFNPNLLLAGNSIIYDWKISKKLSLKTRLAFDATGDEPAYETDEEESERVRREKTNELDFFLQYDFTHSSYLRLDISKDLTAHKGTYFALEGRVDLLNPSEKGLVHPGLFVSVGHGDKKHNEYLYGAGADKAGFNNLEYGFSITSPKVIDNFWPTLKLTKFQILGDENKAGSFVQEKDGFSAEFIFAFKVW